MHSPNNPPSVEHARDPAQNREENIDEQVGAAAALEENAELY